MSLKPGRFTFAAQLLLIVLIMPLAACHKSAKPSTRVFSSPDEAGDALLASQSQAIKTNCGQFSARIRKS